MEKERKERVGRRKGERGVGGRGREIKSVREAALTWRL